MILGRPRLSAMRRLPGDLEPIGPRSSARGGNSCDGHSVMQADRQIQVLPVVQEAGGRKRRCTEQGCYVI